MAFSSTFSATQFVKAFLLRWSILFVVLFISSFSFPHPLLPDVSQLFGPYPERITHWFAIKMLHIKGPFTSRLISDSTGLYVYALLLLLVTAAMAMLWSVMDKNRNSGKDLQYMLLVLLRYYLAMQLLTYGCSKLFKWQFYLPEPNTLFTTVGNTPKDLLLWSTIGTSRLYTMFCGVLEVTAAMFLLFRKTTLAGAFIATGILLNVAVINFSFDVSVKLYSCFLLLLAFIIAIYGHQLFRFFFTGKAVIGRLVQPVFIGVRRRWYILMKTAIILFLFTDALWLYVQSSNYNDDADERPFLHGAYTVNSFVWNGDTLLPLLTDTLRWRRVFVHRRGYLIAQYMNDEMQDYKLTYDTIHSRLLLKKYGDQEETIFTYKQPGKDTLLLSGDMNKNSIQLVLQKIDITTLPALQPGFHWTIDN